MYQIAQESSDQNDPVSSVSIHLSNSSMLQFTLPASMKSVVYYGGNVLANTGNNNLAPDYNDLVIINSDTNLNRNIDNAMVVPYSPDDIVLAPGAESVVCNKPIKITKVPSPRLVISKSGSEFQPNIVHKSLLNHNDLEDLNSNQNAGNITMGSYQQNSSSGNTVVTPVPDSVVCTVMTEDRSMAKQVYKSKVSHGSIGSNYASEVVKLGADLTPDKMENFSLSPNLPDISSANIATSKELVCTAMSEEKKNTIRFIKSRVSTQSVISKSVSDVLKLGSDVQPCTSNNSGANGNDLVVINAGPNQIMGNIGYDPLSSQTIVSAPVQVVVSKVMSGNKNNAKRAKKSKGYLCTIKPEDEKNEKEENKPKVSFRSVGSGSVPDVSKLGANDKEFRDINSDTVLDQNTGNATMVSCPPCLSQNIVFTTVHKPIVCTGDNKKTEQQNKSRVCTRSITSKSVSVVSKLGDLNCGTSLNQNKGNVTLVSYSPNSLSSDNIIIPAAPKPVVCTIMQEDKINAKRRVNKPRVSTRRSVLTSEFASSAQTGANLQLNTAVKPVVNDDFMDLDNDTELSQSTGNYTLVSYSSKNSLSENTVLPPVSKRVSCTVMTQDINKTKQDSTRRNATSESLCDISRIEANLQSNSVNESVISYDDLMDLESESDLDRNAGNVTSISYPADSTLSENTVLAPVTKPVVSTVIPQDIKNSKQVNKSKVSARRSLLTSESPSWIPKLGGWQDCSSEEEEEDVQIISDKPVTCRAVASLPASFLYFGRGTRKPIAEECNGVFAKKEIPRKAQFGPIEGVLQSKSVPSEHHLELSIFNNGVLEKLDVSNENASNWMRYVRCANTSSEQNLSLYQIGQKLYFRAMRRIAPDEELKVWYSLTYARDRKLRLLCPKNKKVSTLPVNSPEKENVSVPEKETQLDEEVSEWRCWHCFKVFKSATTFNLHLLTHAADNIETNENFSNDNDSLSSSIMETDSAFDKDKKVKSVCFICKKAFLTNPALACHLKSHAKVKNFDCPICNEVFNKLFYLRQHIKTHSVDGSFFCPHCSKKYKEYTQIRNHIRRFHCEKNFGCVECSKLFSTVDKLKLHMLSHSDHREFSCEICGKQFKRKDKLGVHMKRAHLPADKQLQPIETALQNPSMTESLEQDLATVENNSSLQKDGKSADYAEFIYKCHICSVGFKRRGMLVNHLANRHPDVTPDSVPELNLPILKAHRDYYCQYCDKIYKSSSKRKAHILKNHPGEKLPLSNRQISSSKEGIENGTYSLTIGSLTTNPQNCDWCHKQYASKAKLLQHQRKHHCNQLPKSLQRPKKSTANSSEEDSDTIRDAVLRVIETDLFLPEALDMSEYEASAGENRFFSGGEFIIDANTLKRAIRGEVLTADCSPETIYELGQIIDARPDGYFKVYQAHSGITLAHPVEVWDPTQLSLSTSPETAAILQPSS